MNKRKVLLYYTRKPETPPVEFTPIILDGTKSYTLDYTVTTGEEYMIADMEYVSFPQAYSGWCRLMGVYVNDSNKWFLGCYMGGAINPGGQYAGSGDITLTLFNERGLKTRMLWQYRAGSLEVYHTPGNWTVGEVFGTKTSWNTSKWTSLEGQSFKVGGLETNWTPTILFYGLRIYDAYQGNLVADYSGALVDGVYGIYNNLTQTFINPD